jgi:hypothetical protein
MRAKWSEQHGANRLNHKDYEHPADLVERHGGDDPGGPKHLVYSPQKKSQLPQYL